eukprot:Opistho-2@82274
MATPLLGRFTKFPCELFRIGAKRGVVLRDFAKQEALGRAAFDFHFEKDGLIHPRPGSEFLGPNGMSLRPGGPNLGNILSSFRGDVIYAIPAGTFLPPHFVLLHEHTDHYSLQTTEPVTLKEINKRMTDFVEQFPVITRKQYFERFPLFARPSS